MTEATACPPYPWEPFNAFKAWKAFWGLVGDRDDTRYVFEFFRAVNGQTMGPMVARFANCAFGQSQIEDRERFARVLLDRKKLESHGPGTFAAAYLNYLDSEGLDPLGVHVAARENAPDLYDRLEREYPEFAAMTYTFHLAHDLHHVLTGYGRDPLGEALLLTFNGNQEGTRGSRLLGMFAGLRIRSEIMQWPVGRMMDNARRMAREAAPLVEVDLSQMMHLPLEEARAELNITPDPLYRHVRDTWTGPEPVTVNASLCGGTRRSRNSVW
jgi:ubiquinone biosynthesis protein COQ4